MTDEELDEICDIVDSLAQEPGISPTVTQQQHSSSPLSSTVSTDNTFQLSDLQPNDEPSSNKQGMSSSGKPGEVELLNLIML